MFDIEKIELYRYFKKVQGKTLYLPQTRSNYMIIQYFLYSSMQFNLPSFNVIRILYPLL